jgi:DHA3 family macrolide efflux protein-like MFS transporter
MTQIEAAEVETPADESEEKSMKQFFVMWGGSEKKVNTAMGALVIEGIAVFLIGMSPSNAVLFATALMLVIGLMMPIFNGSMIAILQSTVPKDKQGRILSLISSGASAMTPIGLGIAGPVSDLIGVTSWFVIAGFVTASLSVAAFFIPAVMNLEERMKQEPGEKEKEENTKAVEEEV